MTNDIKHLHRSLQKGYCCSSAIISVGLYHRGSENPELIEAMKGLRKGMGSGLVCGALSGAACMMSLLSWQIAGAGGLLELTHWFNEVYGSKYGGINCQDILKGGYMEKHVCFHIIEETYKQAKQILTAYGYPFSEEEEILQ